MNDSQKAADALKYLIGAAVVGALGLGLVTVIAGLEKVLVSDSRDMVFVGWMQMVCGVGLAAILSWQAWKAGKVLRRALTGAL